MVLFSFQKSFLDNILTSVLRLEERDGLVLMGTRRVEDDGADGLFVLGDDSEDGLAVFLEHVCPRYAFLDLAFIEVDDEDKDDGDCGCKVFEEFWRHFKGTVFCLSHFI